MRRLIEGIHQFREENFRPHKGPFEQLARGHPPGEEAVMRRATHAI